MVFQYLFNSAGDWIAFRQEKHVFDNRCNWIGWLAWDNRQVATLEGEYMGTIVDVNRLYFFADRPRRPNPGYPSRPTYPTLPDSPGLAASVDLPVGATDVAKL